MIHGTLWVWTEGRQQGLCSLGSTWRERGGLAFSKPVSPLSLHFVYNVASLLDEAELNLKDKQTAMWSTNKCDVLGKKMKGNVLFEQKKASSNAIPCHGLFLLYFILHHIVICRHESGQCNVSALRDDLWNPCVQLAFGGRYFVARIMLA